VLEALGVKTACAPDTVERCLNEHDICFMFAPLFHPATARVAHVRRQLGVRTAFNLLGPLTNPARAPFQILGVCTVLSLSESRRLSLFSVSTKHGWCMAPMASMK